MSQVSTDLFRLPPSNPNPCVGLYGKGPEGKRCKHCRLLTGHRFSRTYYKCQLRGDTHGPATDHRVNWDACSKFIETV